MYQMLTHDYVDWKSPAGKVSNKPHPTPVCESLSLNSIKYPEITYTMKSPSTVTSKLSDLQEETVKLICQSFLHEKAFLLGDATGIGKGRIIAATLIERNVTNGCKGIWVSMNKRLEKDANRDMVDLHYNITNKIGDGPFYFNSYHIFRNDNFESLYDWLGDSPFTLVLDECHVLRNAPYLTPNLLKMINDNKCKVIYSSATAASSANHLKYLYALTPWKEFGTYDSLVKYTTHTGVGCLELVAFQLKERGVFVSRQLSYKGLVLNTTKLPLTDAQIALYDECALHLRKSGGPSLQLFFQRLLCSFKFEEIKKQINKALNDNHSVVVSIQHTGEANLLRYQKNSENSTSCPCTELFQKLTNTVCPFTFNGSNILDSIISEYGRKNVAEITGRTIYYHNGSVKQTPRIMKEVELFQKNKKKIAIMTKAGSTGISLHDEHGRKRIHIIAEFPWGSEDMVQQIGRTHRTGSRSAPEIVLISTDVPAEKRFVYTLAKRLKSLGAITKGDSSGCQWLNSPDWDAKCRRKAFIELLFRRAVKELGFIPNPISGNIPYKKCKLLTLSKMLLSDDTKEEALGKILTEITESASWILPWTDLNHVIFPNSFKSRVIAFMLCAQHNKFMVELPTAILYHIIHFMHKTERDTMADSLEYYRWNLVQLQCDTTWVLNRMLSLPIKLQENMIDVLNDYNGCKQRDYTIDLCDFVQSKVNFLASITDVKEMKEYFKVTLKYNVVPPSYNIHSYVTRISDSKILGVCSKNRFLYLIRANKTCHEHHFTEIQWEYEKKTGRFRVSTNEEIEKYKKTNRNFIVRMNKTVNKTSNII